MKMTENVNNKIYRKKRIIYPLLFIILGGIIVFNIFRITALRGHEKVVAYRLENGWGYRILKDNTVIIDQPFIPLIPGKTPFDSRRKALKTGKLVLSRLQHQVTPVITLRDLEEMEVEGTRDKGQGTRSDE